MSDNLDLACAGMFASHHLDWERMAPEGKQWWRGFVIEALRVMADDIRALHCAIYSETLTFAGCGECSDVWPCLTVRILDSYVGDSNET